MSLTLQNPLKDPSAVLDYVFDWTEWLATGETIESYVITVDAGLTLNSDSESNGAVVAWLSGGEVGKWNIALSVANSIGSLCFLAIFKKYQLVRFNL